VPFFTSCKNAAQARAHATIGGLVVAASKMELFLVIPPAGEESDYLNTLNPNTFQTTPTI